MANQFPPEEDDRSVSDTDPTELAPLSKEPPPPLPNPGKLPEDVADLTEKFPERPMPPVPHGSL